MYREISIIVTTLILSCHGSDLSPVVDLDALCTELYDDNGYSCLNCSTSLFCLKIPGVEQLVGYPESCPDDQSCHKEDGKCHEGEPDDECIEPLTYSFICRLTGMFPHPKHCEKYFMCLTEADSDIVIEKPVELECNNGFHYDPLTTRCRKKPGSCVPWDEDNCNKLGEKYPIDGNPNMYYVCITDNPTKTLMLKPMYCKDGEEFHDECILPETGLDESNKCIKTGDYYLADNCAKYIKCSDIGSDPEVVNCLDGQNFDKWQRKCVPFTC